MKSSSEDVEKSSWKLGESSLPQEQKHNPLIMEKHTKTMLLQILLGGGKLLSLRHIRRTFPDTEILFHHVIHLEFQLFICKSSKKIYSLQTFWEEILLFDQTFYRKRHTKDSWMWLQITDYSFILGHSTSRIFSLLLYYIYIYNNKYFSKKTYTWKMKL